MGTPGERREPSRMVLGAPTDGPAGRR